MRTRAPGTAALATLIAMSIVGGFTEILAHPSLAGDVESRTSKGRHQTADAIGDRLLAGWVDQRIQERQLTAAERRFDEIGWATDLREAERLAKKHGRPVFLFSYNGRVNIGRC
jgi:hypothetical protein